MILCIPWGNGGTDLISSWKSNFSIYLDIHIYYFYIQAIIILLCLLLVLYMLVPSIHSFFYLTTALLRSGIFRHSKAYSSHSFQPTGIGLGSLWRGNKCVLPIISAYLLICKFFYFNFKVAYFLKNTIISKKLHKIDYSFFSLKKDNWTYVYIRVSLK